MSGTPTPIAYPCFNVLGLFAADEKVKVSCTAYKNGANVVYIEQCIGSMIFRFDMRPEQAEELAHALTECAAFMRGLS